MDAEISILVGTALAVGVGHTLMGPDHYVPFVAMSKANRWSLGKAIRITAICGLGHVAGSVVIGLVGLILGTAVFRIESLESFRGDGAAWLLIGFGMAYFAWGIVRAIRNVPHSHLHTHADGTVHSHTHKHEDEHLHVHEAVEKADVDHSNGKPRLTPWVLFLIFVFGPCEVLIPLLMYPAAEANGLAIVAVVIAFTVGTVGTMIVAVAALTLGLRFVRLPDLHRFGHATAGFAVLMCGAMMKLGL